MSFYSEEDEFFYNFEYASDDGCATQWDDSDMDDDDSTAARIYLDTLYERDVEETKLRKLIGVFESTREKAFRAARTTPHWKMPEPDCERRFCHCWRRRD